MGVEYTAPYADLQIETYNKVQDVLKVTTLTPLDARVFGLIEALRALDWAEQGPCGEVEKMELSVAFEKATMLLHQYVKLLADGLEVQS